MKSSPPQQDGVAEASTADILVLRKALSYLATFSEKSLTIATIYYFNRSEHLINTSPMNPDTPSKYLMNTGPMKAGTPPNDAPTTVYMLYIYNNVG